MFSGKLWLNYLFFIKENKYTIPLKITTNIIQDYVLESGFNLNGLV